jgi:hypothetical protein
MAALSRRTISQVDRAEAGWTFGAQRPTRPFGQGVLST